ncbi:histidine phosphatase family protein, partial [Desulfovibrio sp. OttesenSCG-928-I05]|nr:histidine phosphatase family protein [Desulfovibrio sp. OttesenSCG-928-I05]
MKTVRFYLVRHGQTYSNLRKMMIGGGGSAPLTPRGRQAAKHLGLELLDTPFVAAYASPLARAVETARLALGGRDMPVVHVEGLRDVFWGDMEGGIPADIVAMKKERPDDPYFPLGNLDTPEYRSPFNGETICAFVERFEKALTAIAKEHQETGGDILAVSHAGLGSFLAVKGGPHLHEKMDTVNISRMPEVDNTSVSIVEWNDGVFTVKSVNDLSPIRKGEAIAAAKNPLEITLFSDVETLFSRKRLLEGCCDSMLTEEGKKRARKLRAQYAATP